MYTYSVNFFKHHKIKRKKRLLYILEHLPNNKTRFFMNLFTKLLTSQLNLAIKFDLAVSPLKCKLYFLLHYTISFIISVIYEKRLNEMSHSNI